MKKNLLLTALFIIIASSCSFAQNNASYRSSLKQLMQLSGAEGTYKGVISQMITLFKQQQPSVPAAFWDEFTVEMNKVAIDQVVDLILPAYQKHLTEEEIKGVIAFYKTPVGKKYASKTPVITQESMIAGQVWGKTLGEKVIKRLREKGYLKK
ncbi:DUF2059 domain-containing protein [Pedobacter ginsengisoli]|uniref:DUF2059 domain-containing protein n=1 Tax=Pedobacter ginsengisoli TaxID=363852 RepID=UPI00254C7AB7|nr:DUF2059 domain-containing protein [Pedobacter ginsengisoli]